MEKNTNMPNADEICLKYILNELDPSDVLLVEQAMKDDENVLIEIESLRATLRKLDKLPESTPPEEVRQKILLQASEYAQNRSSTGFLGFNPSNATSLAAAAILFVSISIGLYSYSSTNFPASNGSEVNPSSVSAIETSTPDASLTNIAGTGNAEPAVQPWVDNNKVLRINVANSASGLSIISPETYGVMPSSRLIPIERPSDSFGSGMRDIQLTRTQY